jgi:tetratricopeptide (TPR) repeat protein
MTKENVLFIIIGVLAGFMIGFYFANSVNQGALTSTATSGTAAPGMTTQSGPLPEGHPAIPGSGGSGGSVPEIQAAIDKARQNPTDFEAQMKAAELYYQIQRFDNAIEFLKKANELQPDNYEVLVTLGNANFDAGKYDDAEKTYTKALAKKPDDADVRTDLGLTYVFREKPDYDRAIQEFKRVLEKDPNHVQALQNLTVAYTKNQDVANANATLAKLEQVDASNAAVSKLREEIQNLPAK